MASSLSQVYKAQSNTEVEGKEGRVVDKDKGVWIMYAAVTAAGPLRKEENNYPAWALHQLEPGGSLGKGGATGWWLISLVPCENSHRVYPIPQPQPSPPSSSSSPSYVAYPTPGAPP